MNKIWMELLVEIHKFCLYILKMGEKADPVIYILNGLRYNSVLDGANPSQLKEENKI